MNRVRYAGAQGGVLVLKMNLVITVAEGGALPKNAVLAAVQGK
jgi:hypothetical protein